MECQTTLPAFWETCMQVKKQKLELDMEQTGSKLGKSISRLYIVTLLGSKLGKSTSRLLSPCLFNLYAEYILLNASLDEVQAGIKIDGRNINNLAYADDNILMAESEETLKSLLMKVKEDSEKDGLKTFRKWKSLHGK